MDSEGGEKGKGREERLYTDLRGVLRTEDLGCVFPLSVMFSFGLSQNKSICMCLKFADVGLN